MITTIWPARKDWKPGGSWRQDRRWLVLDVTRGLDQAVVLQRCPNRAEACAISLLLRGSRRPS